jgi:hypothetical protein
MKNIWNKLFNKKKYSNDKVLLKLNKEKDKYFSLISPELDKVLKNLKTKKEISFIHYGHLGDIINCLPFIKEVSKNKKCNLFIQLKKKIPEKFRLNDTHPFGEYYLNEKSAKKMIPLLKKQNFLKRVEFYKKQNIDINLNFFRELPINFNMDSVRWYFHLAGIHTDLSKPYILTKGHKKFKKNIVIVRSLRRQNIYINYKFLKFYKNVLFIGLKDEYLDLKKQIPNLKFHDCKNFLEMAMIIKNCKVFIGNLTFGYALAEAIKVPRLLESNMNLPLVYPNGVNAYDFYFQKHFENLFKKLYNI